MVDAVTAADWGGSLAAGVSIVLLFRKSIGYWYASIVATSLWFYVFVETDSAMAAGLQLSYILFAFYGIARWRRQRRGEVVPAWLDHAGTAVALAIFGAAIVLTDFLGWTSYVELTAVGLSLLANWLTALKRISCWPVWIASNGAFAALFYELELWGLFTMQFVYAALSVVGFVSWRRSARTTGLVVGKFAPLHAGHQRLIEFAQTRVARLLVVVYDTPGYEPPAERRANWIRTLYASADVIVLPDPEPRGDDDAISAAYAADLRRAVEAPITHVFTSEEYGPRFARYLGAKHIPFDPQRRLVPISSTAIRAEPFALRKFLAPHVYREFVTKVCFVGAESTGKTSLAEACAERFETVWMPEYGRELFELKQGRLDFEDLLEIAYEHLRREEALVQDARGFLFCDTNAVTTEFWSRFYFGRVDDRLSALARSVQRDYLYVLCGNEIEWVQDGWRETGGGEPWVEHQGTIREDLDGRGLPYLEVAGTLADRVDLVAAWLAGKEASPVSAAAGERRGQTRAGR